MAIHLGLPNYAIVLLIPVTITIVSDMVIVYSTGREYLREYGLRMLISYLFAEYIAVIADNRNPCTPARQQPLRKK